jgi:hypothetical protein
LVPIISKFIGLHGFLDRNNIKEKSLNRREHYGDMGVFGKEEI